MDNSKYKGYDFLNQNKRNKISCEYFNPYGYNLCSSLKDEVGESLSNPKEINKKTSV